MEGKQQVNDLLNKTNAIDDALLKLEKAMLILGKWDEDYSFNNNPTPQAALEFAKGIRSGDDLEGKQSFKWFREYNTITTLINIASDYVYESKRTLEKVNR